MLLSFDWVPDTQGGPALFLSFGGEFHIEGAITERWHLITEMSTASAVNTLIGGDFGFKVSVPDAEGAAFKRGIALEARPDVLTGLSYDLSPLRGFGVQFGLIRIEASLTKDEALVQTTLRDAALTLAPKAFDNFLGEADSRRRAARRIRRRARPFEHARFVHPGQGADHRHRRRASDAARAATRASRHAAGAAAAAARAVERPGNHASRSAKRSGR